jgi:CheY-like chemotaxis protein
MSQNRKPVLVLLADDDPRDQNKMIMALNGAETELKIDLVDNGMQLIDFLVKQYSGKNKQLPDLIITDLYMPFAGGLHVLKQIRKREEFKQIPIYVFSANYDNMIRTKVLENGATEFHQKPGDFTTLQNIVQGILSRSQPVLLA